MPILVSGSIAVDHIMVFRDRFKNHIQPDKIHTLNVAFHVPDMRKTWGGCGANIAFHLKRLGEEPLLLGAVGSDFEDYAAYLDGHGVGRDHVLELADSFTASCFITTDLDDNQITAFHPGAMDRAHEAEVGGVDQAYEWGIVSPNGKEAMLRNARDLKALGKRTVVDPGQAIPIIEPDEMKQFVEGASLFIVNDYEWSLVQSKTGLSEDELASRCDAVIVTLGAKGALLIEGGRRTEIPSVAAERVLDPTGAGDAFRAGLLLGCARGLDFEASARIGAVLGSMKVAHEGPQGLLTDLASLQERHEASFGSPFE